jgi:serine O-acetyltransferase
VKGLPSVDGESAREEVSVTAAATPGAPSAPSAAVARPLTAALQARNLQLADDILSAGLGLRAGLAADGPLPSRENIGILLDELIEILLPESHRMGTSGGDLRDHVARTIASLATRLAAAVFLGLHRHCKEADGAVGEKCRQRANEICERLLSALPALRAELAEDILAAFESDPAASGVDEIVACYPGLYAIAIFRVAHRLLRFGAEVIPRMLTEHAHSRTGIDIHPGATVGSSFFIDHGTGIVIGETTHIGNRVRIYQGVTLGALSIRDRGRTDKPNPAKRHPTIEDDVIIYANATILGGQTVIGRGAVVGGNAWITYSVPAGIRVGVGT